MPVHTGFVTWCDACGWGLIPEVERSSATVMSEQSFANASGPGIALFKELKASNDFTPKWTTTKRLAFALATVVHLTTLVYLVLGIWFIVRFRPNFIMMVWGLFCLGIAYAVFPRLGKLPTNITPREKIPTLYQLADKTSEALGIANVSGIVLNTQFSAAFEVVGWRRDSILYIGLPLFSILSSEEKNTLIAHELAHGANGDSTRGLYIGSALATLDRWIYILMPHNRTYVRGTNLVYRLLRYPAQRYANWLNALLMQDKQRAEYLADHLATKLSGKDAHINMLRKVPYAGTLHRAVVTMVSSQQYNADLFEIFQQRMAEVPTRELERIWRVEELRIAQRDSSHPPLPFRRAMLETHGFEHGLSYFSEKDHELLTVELEQFKPRIQRQLIDNYRTSLG